MSSFSRKLPLWAGLMPARPMSCMSECKLTSAMQRNGLSLQRKPAPRPCLPCCVVVACLVLRLQNNHRDEAHAPRWPPAAPWQWLQSAAHTDDDDDNMMLHVIPQLTSFDTRNSPAAPAASGAMAMVAIGTPAAAAAASAALFSAPGPPSKKRENWLRHCFVRCPSWPHLKARNRAALRTQAST